MISAERTYKLFLTFILCICALYLNAQNKKELDEGDEIVVIKPYEPVLSDAYKITENPKTDTVTVKLPELSYSVSPVRYPTNFELSPIKAVKIKDENLTKLYKNYAKLGFGNYTTPYGELYTNSLRSKEYSLGAHLKHISSNGRINGYAPAGYSDNIVSVYGKKFLPNYVISSDLNYTRNAIHFYGFKDTADASEKALRQHYNYYNASLELASRYLDKTKLQHNLKLNYYLLKDRFTSRENDFSMEFNGAKPIDKYTAGLKLSEEFIGTNNGTSGFNRNIFNLQPTLSTQQDEWQLTAGFKTTIETEPTQNIFHFYPHADFKYRIFEDIINFYATFTGGVEKNNLRSLSIENPFITSLSNYKNTNNKIDFTGGLKGSLSKNTSFVIGAGYKEFNNLALFVNDTLAFNTFNVIYDKGNSLNVHGELNFQKSEKIRLLLKGDYFRYSMENELKAWNKPELQISLSGQYNIQNKIIAKADIFVYGNRYSKLYNPERAYKLNPFVDANLSLEYRYSKILGAFLNFNNLGAVKYYQWYNYPVQRFNVLAGISYSF